MGYKEDFLPGTHLPLPNFSATLSGEILRHPNFRDDEVVEYEHYSVVMNKLKEKRSLVYAALNINQRLLKDTHRQRKWYVDSRIGPDYQLNNDYYRHNPWDRGHQARRTSAAWGKTQREAQKSSDSTFFYSNATLQHENLNQDEWLQLEDWVKDLGSAKEGKISVFTGPFYGENARTIQPSGRPLALIPSGFFKVVCYIDADTNQLAVKAFVIYQDEEALSDKDGALRKNNAMYQSTIGEIELLTGLDFDDAIYNANPLFFNESSARDNGLEVITPERYEVHKPADVINASNENRPNIQPQQENSVLISGAMINPRGEDVGREWVSILNLSHEPVDLTGWSLSDNSELQLEINSVLETHLRVLQPGESQILYDVSPLQLSNTKDVIALFDNQGAQVDIVKYQKSQVRRNKPLWFISRDLRV